MFVGGDRSHAQEYGASAIPEMLASSLRAPLSFREGVASLRLRGGGLFIISITLPRIILNNFGRPKPC